MATSELCASPYTRIGLVDPGGHHHSVNGVPVNDFDVTGFTRCDVIRSTSERCWIPWTSNSGASFSESYGGLLARGQGIFNLTDPAFHGPPATDDLAPYSSRRFSSWPGSKPLIAFCLIRPSAKLRAIAFAPGLVCDDGVRVICLTISKYESFLNGWWIGG